MNFEVRHKTDRRLKTMFVGEDFLKWNPDWEPMSSVPYVAYTLSRPRPRAKTTFEIWRTVASVLSVGLQLIVLLKVFGVI